MSKAARGVVNITGTEMVRRQAADLAQPYGTSAPARGTRPNPGALPDASLEADPDAMRFQMPWGGNLQYTPRTGFGTPFSVLRGLASTSPVVGMCIQCRKDQMASLDFDYTVKDKKSKGKADDKIAQARAFFAKPDGVTPFKTWVQTLVDEVLTIDALSIYRRPIRGTGSGRGRVAGSDLYGYEIIDGATIKVLLDARGFVPQPPNIAYRQVAYGAPITGGDFTQAQLLYAPKTVRTWTPYGMSPLESLLLIVTAELNRSIFNVSYYTKGNIPEALAGVPDSWNPKQIRQWNEYWNLLLKGDPENRAGMRWVSQSMAKTVHEFRKADFTTNWDLWLLKLECACFGVTPSEIGFTDDVNKATSKSQGDVNQRRGVKPMANFIKGILDLMLVEVGLEELEATYSGGEGEDALTQARIDDIQIRNGSKSLDEVRASNGDTTLGIGPAIVTPSGPVFWEDVKAASEAAGVDPGGDQTPDDLAGADPGDDPAATAQQADLKKFRTVAIKAVKAGKRVPVFKSAAILPRVQARLRQALTDVTSIEDVRKVFDAVEKAQRLSAAQKKHQARMNSKLKTILAGAGSAFAAHVAVGVEAHG